MAQASELYLGHFCLPGPAAERFDAAANAGFTGVSLFWPEVCAAREAEGGLAGIRRRLADAGMAAPQMEIILLPAGEDLPAFPALARDIAQTSAELGCEVVHAAALVLDTSFAELTRGFGALAEACADAGLKCGVEFVPFITAVPDLAGAVRLIRTVDAPGAGLVVDSLHFFRCGAPWRELEALRPDDVVSIQVNDGPLRRPNADYHAEAMGMRLLPGDGEFDLVRFLGVLGAVAPAVPLTAEVINAELMRLPAREAARRIADSARALQRLHRADGPQPIAG